MNLRLFALVLGRITFTPAVILSETLIGPSKYRKIHSCCDPSNYRKSNMSNLLRYRNAKLESETVLYCRSAPTTEQLFTNIFCS